MDLSVQLIVTASCLGSKRNGPYTTLSQIWRMHIDCNCSGRIGGMEHIRDRTLSRNNGDPKLGDAQEFSQRSFSVLHLSSLILFPLHRTRAWFSIAQILRLTTPSLLGTDQARHITESRRIKCRRRCLALDQHAACLFWVFPFHSINTVDT